MSIRQTDRLYVCQDCYYWGQYGWEPGTDYPEGWTGPDHPALLSARYVEADCPAEQECCCGHFSWQQCQGCGSGLGGDRYYIATYGEERAVSECVWCRDWYPDGCGLGCLGPDSGEEQAQ